MNSPFRRPIPAASSPIEPPAGNGAPPPSYLRNITTVLTGTVMAQAIPLLSMPILTRVVTPGEMGVFNSWMGVVAVLLILGSARLEILLITGASGRDKQTCVSLAWHWGTAVAIITAVAALIGDPLIRQAIPGWWGSASVALGAGVVFAAMNIVFQALIVSNSNFRQLTHMRVLGAGAIAVLQIVGALTLGGASGVAWGYVIGTALGVLYAHFATAASRRDGLPPNWSDRGEYARRNIRLPLYAIPADLLNAVAQQLPLLLVAYRFGPAAAGLLGLAIRTLDAPIAIISKSVQDAYKTRAANEFAETGNCRPAFMATLKLLAVVAIAPMAVVLIAGPWLFSFVFGLEWRESGVIAMIFAPMFYIRFFASPLGFTLYIVNKPQTQLFWQAGLVVVTMGAFFASDDLMTAIAWYSTLYAMMYVLYLSLCYRGALGNRRQATPT